MNKMTSTKTFTSILALAFAILLFFTANSESGFLSKNKVLTAQPTLSAVADDVPIKIKYDDTEFFVSGYLAATTVYLNSSNKVLLDTESNAETRSFSLVVDLTDYKEGSYEVPIEFENLHSGIEATLKNETVNITLEKRVTKSFKIETKINDNLLKNGYQLDKLEIEPETVEITTGQQTMDSISQVLVSITEDQQIMKDFSKRLEVFAIDEKGNILSVIAVPSTVTVGVQVSAPLKTVPVRLKQAGKIPTSVEEFSFTSETKYIEITGPKEELDKIDEVSVLIDTSTITETATNVYEVEVNDSVQANPAVINVTVEPKLKEK